ncbi:MAG TPA: NAD(P)-dependent alcohol dehydrogenase [Steroidobacteraceae bacterium]|nr:NAD(P)-dependent alcohol dehydrogenase [Steroidobacteraceae bacterium]
MKLRYRILGGIGVVLLLALVSLALALSHDSACGPTPALPANAQSMQAIVSRCYGPPEVLRLEAIAKPVPAADELLVRVHAASVNPLDFHYMRGKPYLVRLGAGMGAPDVPRLGVDFAGTVEAVGSAVTHFKPGDEVFGGRTGAFAEYVTVRESRAVVLKPANVTFEQAASLPIAAITALQALRDKGHLKPGQKVLVNGASGGVGTFTVQIAKAFGAEVTGVCSTKNLALVQSLGADHVVDYTQEDFTQSGQHYDVIVDTVGTHSLLDYRRALNPTGSLIMVGSASVGDWIDFLISPLDAIILSKFVGQKFIPFLAELNPKDLTILGELIQSGKMTPVIDRRYSLKELPAAMRYVESGHARGKVIITVD